MAWIRGATLLVLSSALIGLASCDSDVTAPDDDGKSTPPFVTGSRLEARVHAVGDAELFVGWYDSKLDIPCQFITVTASDDLRCAPDRNDPSAAYITSNEIVYSDASCTQPLRIALRDVEPPPLVLGEETLHESGCGQIVSFDVHHLGAPTDDPEAVFYRFGDACEWVDGSYEYDYYELGAKVAPDELVGAAEHHERRDAHLAARVLRADDGSREIVGAWDLSRDSACWLGPFGEDDGPCVPFTLAFATGDLFGNDACEHEPLAYANNSTSNSTTCEAATVAAVLADGCDWLVGFATVGEEVEQPHHLDSFGSRCLLASEEETEGHRYFRIGDPLDAGTFPALELVSLGEGRVKLNAVSAPDGTALIGVGFFDTELGATCSPREMCDGTLRCAPKPYYADPVEGPFRNETCTEPLFVTGAPCDESQLPRVVFIDDFVECSIHERGAEYDGAIHYIDPDNGCYAAVRDEGSRYFEIGAELPIESMPEVIERTVGGS